MSSQPSSGAVHPDTQAVLLLCGQFDARDGGAKPLTLGEYNRLAAWLSRQGKRPSDLLGLIQEMLEAAEAEVGGAGRVEQLLKRGMQLASSVERWHGLGIWVLSRGETAYPRRLRRGLGNAAPPLLYGVGDPARLELGGLAVVGSRDVEDEDRILTERVAERCAGQGVQVVSGGARGIDQTAMCAALNAGGSAAGVLAERLDRAATTRGNREAIQGGKLTLISPYPPEAHFSVGQAMGRNKLIYALADFALVVRFAHGEGGTWAGVDEHLRKNKSSSPARVFVNVSRAPEAGWSELRGHGARPFPEADFFTGNVAEVLGGAAEAGTVTPAPAVAPQAIIEEIAPPAPVPTPRPEAPAPAAETCYTRCLPLLLDCFREAKGAKALASLPERLGLVKTQFDSWLKRAIDEGHLVKKKKSGRVIYLAANVEAQSTLFRREDDAA
jgi:predicted Rossmann fold nucleotide-binding protein DprA/Smf involved in DNA uptake